MTLTDEMLGQIEERWRIGNDEHIGEDMRAVLDEVWRLRHDISRHMEIANEHLAECERLRAEVKAAKSFGGGFYGEQVEKATRDKYRRVAALSELRRLGQEYDNG